MAMTLQADTRQSRTFPSTTAQRTNMAKDSIQPVRRKCRSSWRAWLRRGLVVAGAAAVLWNGHTTSTLAENIRFKKHQLDPQFRSEGVAVADFNRDGKPDIAAGTVWYEAPDWKMHSVDGQPMTYDPKGYSHSFVCAAEDLNHDEWPDLMVVDFPGAQTWWFENPQGAEGAWKKHVVTPVTNNESPQYVDIDGDGRREWLMGVANSPDQPDAADRRMAVLKPAADPTQPWQIQAISAPDAVGARRFDHGLGYGDLNGDGTPDFAVADGWYAGSTDGSPAKFTPQSFGGPCAHMHIYDVDGDGDADVLNSSAHAFGIWWNEQTAPGQFTNHLIDDGFSQTHSLCVADINGDGLLDFVTGKRWWAHAAGDPGVDQPAVMHWFEAVRKDGKVDWVSHQFDHDSGVGTQFELADVNQDGLLDVVTSNKKGTHWFQQIRE